MTGTIAGQILLSIAVFVLPYSASIAQNGRITSEMEVIDSEDSDDATDIAGSPAIGRFGPFAVVAQNAVEMRGVIDADTPGQFRQLMSHFPGVRQLNIVECPGSEDDEAALNLARLVHGAGIDTHVPASGSVRSSGVELFLAGIHRSAEPGAEFGVHSWQDDEGREARDVPADDPVHADYIRYYVSVGLKPELAKAFYDFTNAAAPFGSIHYMTPAEVSRFHLTTQ
jgi:hypothetical protein